MRLRSWLTLVLLVPPSVLLATRVRAGEAAEALLRLAPADAGMTLLVEDLRGHARQFFQSALAEGLGRLPAIRDWRASERAQALRQAKHRIENAVGEPLATLRDDLLGDAVVLALHLDPDETPDQARGLLLTHVRNQPLLDRVIAEFNAAQGRKGEIARIVAKDWHGTPYSARVYRDARRPTEFYAAFDQSFAWSNSEALLRGVLDRRSNGPSGLGSAPRFQRVRQKLAGKAAVSLFLDGAFLRRVLATAPQPNRPSEDRVAATLKRYIDALEYAGASLEWHDGLVIQEEETLNPACLDPWIKTRAEHRENTAPELLAVPASALAMASLHVDFPALLQAIETIVPDDGRTKLANAVEVLRGILLGRDVRTEILPHLGPSVLAYVEAPQPDDSTRGLSVVVSVGLGGDSQLAPALENGLRTWLALYALDDQRAKLGLTVRTSERDGVSVVALGPWTPFAFAVRAGRLVLARSPEAVVRAFRAERHRGLEALRAAQFPDARSFAVVDLVGLKAAVASHRAAVVRWLASRYHRPADTEDRDLDQALALIGLFKAAYATSTMAPDAASVHRTAGLILADPVPAAAR